MAAPAQTELLGLDIQELTALVEAAGEPPYRARQLFEAIYRQRVRSLDEISTLPVIFRRSLNQRSLTLGYPRVEKQFSSSDGTIRYLLGFSDGQSVETVWMPEGDGGEEGDTEVPAIEHSGGHGFSRAATAQNNSSSRAKLSRFAGVRGRRRNPERSEGPRANARKRESRDLHFADDRPRWDRATICVSSQVGCAVDCQFCLTALLGLRRNLTAGEIVGQVIAVLNDRGVALDRDRINLVFMGQGEPFLNYDNFIKAVRLLVQGVGVPESRMTVSTAGIVPRIYDFGQEPVRPKLAISLNAPNNVVRRELMPITCKWDIEQLIAAARAFPLRARERLTFEYVLLDQVNDSIEAAKEVAELLRGIRAKVNLISWNPGPGVPFGTPEEQRVLAFQQVLIKSGIPAFVRRPRGRDIFAACGQLKLSA